MRIEYVKKNYEMSSNLKEVIEQKLEKLEKYLDDDAVIKLNLRQSNDRFKMEISVHFNGKFIRAEVASENMYDNIDDLIPKVEGQMRKYKTKFAKDLKTNAFAGQTEEIDTNHKIVKTKDFKLTPMDLDWAMMQLDLVGHDFYVFQDVDSRDINIVYRRDDGTVGLLKPSI